MSLRGKLLLAQVLIVLALIAIATAGGALISTLGRSSQAILKDNYRSVLAAQRVKDALERMDRAALSSAAGAPGAGLAAEQDGGLGGGGPRQHVQRGAHPGGLGGKELALNEAALLMIGALTAMLKWALHKAAAGQRIGSRRWWNELHTESSGIRAWRGHSLGKTRHACAGVPFCVRKVPPGPVAALAPALHLLGRAGATHLLLRAEVTDPTRMT